MDNFFDKSLHYLGKNYKDVFVMNIGAMDGVMFDEMIGYTNMYNFKGLYVEPIPYLFEKLKSNIGSDNLFENSAISEYDGEIDMITIKKEVIDSGLVHNCFYGMSAVYPPKNGLGSEFDKPTVDKYGEIVKVNCITYENLLNKYSIDKIDVIKIDAEGHDYKIFKQIDLNKYGLKVIRLEWINLTKTEQNQIIESFKLNGFKYEISGQDIVGMSSNFYDEVSNSKIISKNKTISIIDKPQNNSKVTLVTGLWDIGRGNLIEGWGRPFNHYLEKFEQLLKVEETLIIFGDQNLKEFVFKHRSEHNTQFIERSINWFKTSEFYDLIQKIRTNSNWFNQVGWLKDSTQSKLENYNPLVMSKIYLLHDAKLMDKFNSEYMFWIDGGITNTVHSGYFTHDKVLSKLDKYISKFSFVCFPYEASTEIHGFEYNKLNELANAKVKKVARGGFFGGHKDTISDINSIYYGLMKNTLSQGYMGTEESLFSIMCYKHADLINYFEIESNGLMGKFFEDLKNDNLKVKSESLITIQNNLDTNKVGLYVITFNSPNQFETLINSMIEYDKDFIDKPKKFLLDNSTDLTTTPKYLELCEKYGFEHIKKDNLGIMGGRIFISEHFNETGLDFQIFFEDDMALYPKKGEVCRNGFPRYVNNLYQKSLEIIKKENFDFLKYSFTEFYGSNDVQFSWYNVPQDFREKHWDNNPKLPTKGLDPNAPKTEFKNINVHKGLPYINGEIYISNWPIILTKQGNYKCYLETKWQFSYEQTTMSYVYQETVKGNINPGILLLSPIEHNRFDHYDGKLRKES